MIFGSRFSAFNAAWQRIFGLLSDFDIKFDYTGGPEVVGVDYVVHAFAVSNSLTLTRGPFCKQYDIRFIASTGRGCELGQVHAAITFENGRFKSVVQPPTDQAFFRLRSQ
jgi:hypothetical protein